LTEKNYKIIIIINNEFKIKADKYIKLKQQMMRKKYWKLIKLNR